MIPNNNISKTELAKIIRSLVNFIVVDGKDFVKDGLKKTYIKQYLYILSKSMNDANSFVCTKKLKKAVEIDISNFLKKEIIKK